VIFIFVIENENNQTFYIETLRRLVQFLDTNTNLLFKEDIYVIIKVFNI